MSWNEYHGRVTRAFDEWRMTDRDIRGFLRFSLRIANEAYTRIWDEASREPAYDDSPELVDVFHDRIEGIWENDYRWMLLSGGLIGAVTAFDVYLEKAIEEVLRRHGHTATGYTNEKALSWEEATDFYKRALGVRLKGHQDLSDVRDLRHILTHKRGELRTHDQRKRFGKDPDGWIGDNVELTLDSTLDYMDVLARHVERVDKVAYEAAWGSASPATLADYIAAKRRP
ncbi:MAG: hypothetical protein M3O70_19595 [Actinomycetota bacterium]|nr:hypothetical protein [Actinomycetota bacterium]